MAHLFDTDILIHLRDGEPIVWGHVRDLGPPVSISVITRIELENGIHADPKWTDIRRTALDKILSEISTIDFTDAELQQYRRILEAVGFTKSKINDRMIAATALAHDLTLVTMNGKDFRDVPGLELVEWRMPRAGLSFPF